MVYNQQGLRQQALECASKLGLGTAKEVLDAAESFYRFMATPPALHVEGGTFNNSHDGFEPEMVERRTLGGDVDRFPAEPDRDTGQDWQREQEG